jgi:hypothetical protein
MLYMFVSVALPCAIVANTAADRSELRVSKDRRVAAASIAILEGLKDAVRAISLCRNDYLSTLPYDTPTTTTTPSKPSPLARAQSQRTPSVRSSPCANQNLHSPSPKVNSPRFNQVLGKELVTLGVLSAMVP